MTMSKRSLHLRIRPLLHQLEIIAMSSKTFRNNNHAKNSNKKRSQATVAKTTIEMRHNKKSLDRK